MVNMATAKQVKNFIETIAPYIVAYAKKYGYKVASPIIAMACIESAYGKSKLASTYFNFFGMKCGTSWKGMSVNMATKEEYTVGTLTDIRANFRAYSDIDAGVRGFFDFISTKRYANLKSASTPKEFLEMIKADGYATSSTYVSSNMAVVEKYNLTSWDSFEPAAEPVAESPKEKSTSIRYATVTNCSYLNCRDKANGNVIGIFSKNTVLVLHEKVNGWWKVTGKPYNKAEENITGFCASRYLKEV